MTYKMFLAAAGMTLLAITLYASAAHRSHGRNAQDRTVTITVPNSAKPDAFEEQLANGQVTRMTLIKMGGAREIMQPQPSPACNTGCPAGQHMVCWTDHDQGMSICECQGGGGGGGGGGGPGRGGEIHIESFSWG